MIGGIRRLYQVLVVPVVVLIFLPLPWFSMIVLSVIGLTVEEDISTEYQVLYYGGIVFLGLVAFLTIRKCYPEKIPASLRTRKKKKN